jgi:hypothetical protein
MPYSRKTMQANHGQLPTLSRRILFQALLLGTVLSIALLLIDGPIWLCYVAPFIAVPFVVHHLRALDPPRRHGGAASPLTRDRSEDA